MSPLAPLAPGVFVSTSERFMTTTTVVVGDDGGCLVVDPAVTRFELDGLAAELTAASLVVRAGFSTHHHWDHVLWHPAWVGAARYRASATTRN
ncbi:MAG: MBL fold metallo-hydrolase [Acidimicrobiales bacterium]